MGLINENGQRINEEDLQFVQQLMRDSLSAHIYRLHEMKKNSVYEDESNNAFYDPIIAAYQKALDGIDKTCLDAFSSNDDISVDDFMRGTLDGIADKVAPTIDKDSECFTDFMLFGNTGFGALAYNKLWVADQSELSDQDKKGAYSDSTENFVLADVPIGGIEDIAEYNPNSVSVKGLTVARSGNSNTLSKGPEEYEAAKQEVMQNDNFDEEQKQAHIERIDKEIEDHKKGVFGLNAAAEIARSHSVKLSNIDHVTASDLYSTLSDLNMANRPADPQGGKIRAKYVEAGEIKGISALSMPSTVYRTMNDIADYMNNIKETPDPALRKTRALQLAAFANTVLLSEHVFGDANGRTCRMFADTILQTFGLPPHTPMPEIMHEMKTMGSRFDHGAITNLFLQGVKKSDETLAHEREIAENKRRERETEKRNVPKTAEDTADRNRKLLSPIERFREVEGIKIDGFEREALLNNRAPSVPFSELMDSVLMFRAGLPVDQLPGAYRNLISKADAYIFGPRTDVDREEKVRWAQSIKSQAQTALAELNTAVEFGDFTAEELKLPAAGDFFSVNKKKIEKNNALLASEQGYEPLPAPADYQAGEELSDTVLYPEAVRDMILKRCDEIPDIKGKLELLADLNAASNLGILRPEYDMVTEALQDHILLDANGNKRADIEDIKQAAAEIVADWRIQAYREMKETGRPDAKWSKEIIRSEALTPALSMMDEAVERYGVVMDDLKVVSQAYMNTKLTKEEQDEMTKLGISDTTGISNVRKYPLDIRAYKDLSARLPGLTIDDGYMRSLASLKNDLNQAAASSDLYRDDARIKRIAGSLDTLSSMASLRSGYSSHAAATAYSLQTSLRIKSFMENEALDQSWYAKGNEVRNKLLDTLKFTNRPMASRYIEKETILRERAENISHGRQQLDDFFEEQSGASKDTLKKLVAANGKNKNESVAKMAVIIEKRYGLGREFSMELAKGVKNAIDTAAKTEKDPVSSWKSTADLMKDAVKNTSCARMNDYRISRKGDRVKADHRPRLRDESIRQIISTESRDIGEKCYGDKLLGLLERPEDFDTMKEMFDTKKNYRLLNWNSSEYNDAKEALDSFAKERDKLIEMADGYEGRRLTAEEKKALNDQIRVAGEKREKCVKALYDYIKKEGVSDTSAKSQTAGYARIMGAKGIMDVFIKTDPELTSRLSDPVKQAMKNDRIKVRNYSELFREEYKNAERSGKKDRHRTAAKAAKQRTDKPVM
ncbi:MAG: Fic family protein [Lachnospiraceae bacterium]|nr:Fic family protein [Lachnospiraceae bacterium]